MLEKAASCLAAVAERRRLLEKFRGGLDMTIHRHAVGLLLIAGLAASASGQDAKTDIPPQITTPDRLGSRLGPLEFKDGLPSAATVDKAYDTLDFTRALNVFLDCYRGASTQAIREGFLSNGARDGDVVVFPELMDSRPLFLTANCDTLYAMAFLNLAQGPMVFECPPMALGAVDDMWFRWVIDLGLPGPDRGQGGKYLLLPPGYRERGGEVPESGYHVAQARTMRVMAFTRYFLENNDPKPAAERILKFLKVYPFVPGGYGTSIAAILDAKATLPKSLLPATPPETKFIDATGKAFNTIPANDFRAYEQLNALVQNEPATALDPELTGQMAAIGIVKGKPFAPDARMKKILVDAAAAGTAIARSINFRFRKEEWAHYPKSAWMNPLFEGGYTFETPPPMITQEGVKPFPPTGARTLDSRTVMFFTATGVTPGMVMRLTGIGSQYLIAYYDAAKNYFDGTQTYKVTLPKGIPAARFWSLTLYDNQTRSMLQTPQRFPRAGSQSYPTPAAVAQPDGSTVVYIGPKQPPNVPPGNWIQSVPGKSWFVILRLYSPLESYFDKSWRLSEIEEVEQQAK
jgi:hypothetical protein